MPKNTANIPSEAEMTKMLSIIHAVNTELTEEPILGFSQEILKHAGQEIKKLLQMRGYHLSSQDSASLEWNHHYQCFEYVAIITSSDNENVALDPNYSENKFIPSLTGRKVRIRLFNNNSNFEQNSNDYIERAKNVADSGIDLIKKCFDIEDINKVISDIQQYQIAIEAKLRVLDPNNQKDHNLAIEYFKVLTQKISKELINIAAKNKQLAKQSLLNFGYIKNDTKLNNKTEDWLKILQKHEANFTALNKRDLLVHVYPGVKEGLWTINSNIPLSDIPSTLRSGAGEILPNWIISNTQYCKLEDNGELQILGSHEIERSSSYSAIKVANKQERLRINKAVAEKKIKHLVIDKIIHKLNKIEDLDALREFLVNISVRDKLKDCFKNDMLVMTLLNITKKIMKPIKAAHENDQFLETRQAFADCKDIKLQEDDFQYILKHVELLNNNQAETADEISELKEYCLDHAIVHNEVFHNFASSGGRSYSKDHQKPFNKEAAKLMEKRIQEHFADHQQIINILNITKQTEKNKKKLKLMQLVELDKYLNDKTNQLTVKDRKVLSLYIRYLKLLKDSSMHDSDNFLMQAITQSLAQELKMNTHITCKSGEDRTGAIIMAIECANGSFAQFNDSFNIHDNTKWQAFKESFWKKYPKIAKFAAGLEINHWNARGSRGFQGQNDNNSAKEHFIVSDRIGRMAKTMYKKPMSDKKYDKLDSQLQEHLNKTMIVESRKLKKPGLMASIKLPTRIYDFPLFRKGQDKNNTTRPEHPKQKR